jgi:hypothetical protein
VDAAGLGREVLTWATRDDDLDDCFGQKCHGKYGRIYAWIGSNCCSAQGRADVGTRFTAAGKNEKTGEQT